MDTHLQELRNQIDSIDKQIILLLKERMDIVALIGKYKKSNGFEPKDWSRWEVVMRTRLELAEKIGLSKEMITKIWHEIHEYALEIEKR